VSPLENLSLEQLKEVAAAFGTEVAPSAKEKGYRKALEEDGISWPMVARDFPQFVPVEEEVEVAPGGAVAINSTRNIAEERPILIRMVRKNPTYEVRGYRFTQDQPFVPVTEEDADWLMENEEGFRQASPSEAREFFN